MKLRDMLKLLRNCEYTVLDLDSGLHTDWIPSWEKGSPQLRTLLDKTVTAICPDGTGDRLIVEVADADADADH